MHQYMEKAEEIIRLEDIRRIYRVGNQEVRALDGVSLSVYHGAFRLRQIHVNEHFGLPGLSQQWKICPQRVGRK